ncbi:hypothetical protein [Halomonas sp. TD01]|uniref:hypothetical protein n=1 Tax=Halomonas sp. TD01 TaxID=999141 RepID=UPI000214F9C9|nr:hypothetical protein [Halomonas sp. TD01]EGP18641.1 hypothetical protein GME_15670 [Halomonas sp. TD01]CAH1044709.1 Phage protein [Halomonas sp. TD01]
MKLRNIKHFHLFCGLGGGALCFNRGYARAGNIEAKFQCLSGIVALPKIKATWSMVA